MLAGALLCCWGTLCLLFWQGNWQLLYHPAAAVVRTPASVGLRFDEIAFAVDETGQARLKGWWIAADSASGSNATRPNATGSNTAGLNAPSSKRYTILYLHGENGNLGDTVDALRELHELGVNVLAFDYRGFGQSRFARPSEEHWREDAEWAIQYLKETRHIAPYSIVLEGYALGADLALEIAAAHPELAGVIVREPLHDAATRILDDPRAKLVPARLFVRDRYDMDAAARALRIPSLWLVQIASPPDIDMVHVNSTFRMVSARKSLVWLPAQSPTPKAEGDALSRWFGDLSVPTR